MTRYDLSSKAGASSWSATRSMGAEAMLAMERRAGANVGLFPLGREKSGCNGVFARKRLLLARMAGRACSTIVAQGMKSENVVQAELAYLYGVAPQFSYLT